ncbi:hypothetical protein QF015_000097 [Paenarthrobacter sp. TE4293]|uniref:hypothetical protein n=1 Tax=Paenarthrobacter sp. TE4293 TaxID=3381695 RepID=UPI003D1BA959
MDLRDAAQELYAVIPRDFTAKRTALVRQAKDAGEKDLAKDIGGLPKPAAGAWAINMLSVHKPEVIDGVVRFGVSLRTAQEEGDAEAFRELGQQRQGQLSAAVHAARDLAAELGAPLSPAAGTDVEQTFRAAMADAGAAAAIGTGRLVRGLSGSGFESVDLTGAVAVPGPGPDDNAVPGQAGTKPAAKGSGRKSATSRGESQPTTSLPKKSSREEATSLADRRAAKQEAALREARSEFEAADIEAKEAEAAASSAWEVVNNLSVRRTGVKSDIEEARKHLAALEAELIGLTRDSEAAESDKKLAVREATLKRRAADQAQRRVDRLD